MIASYIAIVGKGLPGYNIAAICSGLNGLGVFITSTAQRLLPLNSAATI
jgi:hypothetical protein